MVSLDDSNDTKKRKNKEDFCLEKLGADAKTEVKYPERESVPNSRHW